MDKIVVRTFFDFFFLVVLAMPISHYLQHYEIIIIVDISERDSLAHFKIKDLFSEFNFFSLFWGIVSYVYDYGLTSYCESIFFLL